MAMDVNITSENRKNIDVSGKTISVKVALTNDQIYHVEVNQCIPSGMGSVSASYMVLSEDDWKELCTAVDLIQDLLTANDDD